MKHSAFAVIIYPAAACAEDRASQNLPVEILFLHLYSMKALFVKFHGGKAESV